MTKTKYLRIVGENQIMILESSITICENGTMAMWWIHEYLCTRHYVTTKVPYNVIIYILKAIDFSHRPSSGYIVHSQYYKTLLFIKTNL